MSVQSIASSAKGVGKNVFEKGTSAVKWGAHKVGNLGGFLKDKAGVIEKPIFWRAGFHPGPPT